MERRGVVHWSARKIFIWKVMLFLGSIFVYSTRVTLSVCALKIGEELGWDKRISGLVMSTFFMGYVTTQIVGGVIADRYGGDRTIFLSSLVWSSATLLTPYLANFLMLPHTIGIGLAQILAGMTQGVHFPSVASLVSHKVPEKQRNSAFGFIISGTNLGNLFTGSVGSVILQYNGWRSVFVCFGALSLLWSMVVKFLILTEKVQHRSVTGTEGSSEVKCDVEPVPWKNVLLSISFWALLVTTSCESFVFTTLVSWLPTYFQEMYPQSKPWVYNVLPWVATFLSANVSGMLSDRLMSRGVSTTKLRKGFVCTALFVSASLCLLLNHIHSFYASLVIVSILCFFVGLNTCGVGMNPQDLMPNSSGCLYGIMNTAAAIAGMVGVSAMGQILHATQNWSNSFIAISVSASTGGIVFLLFGSGKQIV